MKYIEEQLFDYWITQSKISITRSDKYSKTINTISKELINIGCDIEDLFLIKDANEAETLKEKYLGNTALEAKNKRGNNMYSRSFDLYIEYLRQLPNNEERDIEEILNSEIGITEKKALMLARMGQGKYRNNLIKLWGKCSLSQYSDTSLLVASHIKPWSKCNPQERIDPYNGLLLLPNYDKVFDKGLITFDSTGKIYISSLLHEFASLGLHHDMKINLSMKHLGYIEHHNKFIFKS